METPDSRLKYKFVLAVLRRIDSRSQSRSFAVELYSALRLNSATEEQPFVGEQAVVVTCEGNRAKLVNAVFECAGGDGVGNPFDCTAALPSFTCSQTFSTSRTDCTDEEVVFNCDKAMGGFGCPSTGNAGKEGVFACSTFSCGGGTLFDPHKFNCADPLSDFMCSGKLPFACDFDFGCSADHVFLCATTNNCGSLFGCSPAGTNKDNYNLWPDGVPGDFLCGTKDSTGNEDKFSCDDKFDCTAGSDFDCSQGGDKFVCGTGDGFDQFNCGSDTMKTAFSCGPKFNCNPKEEYHCFAGYTPPGT